MILPDPLRVCDAIDATWPAAGTQRLGSWLIRRGAGGGNRVSAARAVAPVTPADVPQAEAAMRDLGQAPLFMLRPGDDAVDAVLADAGYVVQDATRIYAAPVAALTTPHPPPVTAFTVWPPLAVQASLWAAGGVGPARLDVMARATGPATTILGRLDDQPAGTLFVSLDGDIAMLHALEVAPRFRRRGLAQHLTRAAAIWAERQGARSFTLLTTVANTGANRLYQGLGMEVIGRYHYRAKPKE